MAALSPVGAPVPFPAYPGSSLRLSCPAPALAWAWARSAGARVGWWRVSSRSASGAVVACGFPSWAAAAAFAPVVAARVGFWCACRPGPGVWVVSVPVAAAPVGGVAVRLVGSR
jgi:hypothetical protein